MPKNNGKRLFKTIAATAMALVSSSGLAQAPERLYEMKTYVDFPAGRDVIAGNYAKAIKAAGRSADRRGETGMIANTSLCVAFTKTGRFADAENACTRAVSLAERSGRRPSLWLYSHASRQQDIATALSNRGVLHAVSGNAAAAARDFREAARLVRADAPRHNLARLEASMAENVAMMEGTRD
jgi:Flp pilus assembly protein TadD